MDRRKFFKKLGIASVASIVIPKALFPKDEDLLTAKQYFDSCSSEKSIPEYIRQYPLLPEQCFLTKDFYLKFDKPFEVGDIITYDLVNGKLMIVQESFSEHHLLGFNKLKLAPVKRNSFVSGKFLCILCIYSLCNF